MASGCSAGVDGRRKGRCKWFNVAKGWGFITPDDQGQDVFVHQSVIQMTGFRSLADEEEVEFECQASDKGLEATVVTGLSGSDCRGSHRRPVSKKRFRKIRCYNCGEFANHIAAKCSMGPQPKRCHNCKAVNHLIADCPSRDDKKKGNNDNSRTLNGSSFAIRHTETNGGGASGGEAPSSSSSSSLDSKDPTPSPRLSPSPELGGGGGYQTDKAEVLTVITEPPNGNNGNSSPSPVESPPHRPPHLQVRPSSARGTFIIVTNSGTTVVTSTSSSVACQQPVSTTLSSANGSISKV